MRFVPLILLLAFADCRAEVLDSSAQLARLYELSKKNPNQLIAFIRKVTLITLLT